MASVTSKLSILTRSIAKFNYSNNLKTITTSSWVRSAEPLQAPQSEGQQKVYQPKITNLVDQIAQLNLLEVSDLNDLLRKTLNIKDVPMGGGFAAAAAPAPKEEEEVEVKPTKSSFRLKLVKFDTDKKIALIKEIKSLGENMNLVQAKKFVESMPQIYRDNIGKDEAEKLKEQLEKVGATCEIE